MNNDLLNILSHSNKDIDNQLLMDYLAGKLTAEQKHEVEKLMADNHFVNDALEGLEQVKDKKNIEFVVEQLNRDLRKKTEKKRQSRRKRTFKDQPWIYVAVIIILLLLVVAWYVIKRIKN